MLIMKIATDLSNSRHNYSLVLTLPPFLEELFNIKGTGNFQYFLRITHDT